MTARTATAHRAAADDLLRRTADGGRRVRVGARARVVLAAVLAAAVLVAVWCQSVRADAAYRGSALVVAGGLDVSAQATVSADVATTAEYAGVCFTDASGARVDFPLTRRAEVGPDPVALTATGKLPAGTYSFTACVRTDGVWSVVGSSGELVVAAGSPAVTATTAPAASDGATDGATGNSAGGSAQAAPVGSGTSSPADPATPSAPTTPADPGGATGTLPLGDLPGWRQVLAEGFDTDVAPGRFPGPAYSAHWAGYDGFADSSGSFQYRTRDVASVHDGVLDLHTRTEDGTALGAGVVALVDGDGTWGGRTYGRYSVRFRADPGTGWGAAFLLWSDADDWHDGEIDFAEGMTTATTVDAHNHDLANPAANALSVFTPATWDQWHVATVEWTPQGVTFFLDGRRTGTSATVPTRPLHLVLQTITGKTVPPAGSQAHVLVDWVAAWERT
ncbi:family 16 glycosylhydrolase [Kineococcus sp. DHX-1]|uniref:family 16 glycosylhydrolase n=1 Tax=Kineococcus sp. DHX-1 TaxID=3349638 RepID=UPI0036D23630